YWCNLSRQRLSPYCAEVEAPLIIDNQSANDPVHVKLLVEADWIYLGGGYPHVAMRILSGTPVMNALIRAAMRDTLIIGASAGAMMMCAQSVVITPGIFSQNEAPLPLKCLGFIPNSLCVPHFNRGFAQRWLDGDFVPGGFTLIGIDEQAAL